VTVGRVEGKVALITGGGRGLGRAACLALAREGADIIVAARSPEQLNQVSNEVEALGRRCLGVPTDVTSSASVERLVEAGLQEFGRLDVLVNNAGIAVSSPILATTDAQWESVVSTNLLGAFLLLRTAGRHLVDQGSGKVINVASHWAFRGVPTFASYCASKAAVVNLTRAAAVEWARYGVQVNALAPGYFATDFNADLRADETNLDRVIKGIPMRRMGAPDEFGEWIVLLASKASDFMTGEVIVLDGGENAS
jgi:NAD(P)-dependent dehydrogenase (short-subunit alcohol dehydrogenase family)